METILLVLDQLIEFPDPAKAELTLGVVVVVDQLIELFPQSLWDAIKLKAA